MHVADGVCKQWLRRHFSEFQYSKSAGHPEVHCGDRIRQRHATAGTDASALRLWLRFELYVDVSETTVAPGVRETGASLASF